VNARAEERVLLAEIVASRDALRALAAGKSRRKQDPFSHTHIRDAFTNFGHFAGYIAARNMRESDRPSGKSAPHPKIKMIQRARPHANQNFVRTDRWLGHVGIAKNLGTAVLGN
jgi:hypothetical protein